MTYMNICCLLRASLKVIIFQYPAVERRAISDSQLIVNIKDIHIRLYNLILSKNCHSVSFSADIENRV